MKISQDTKQILEFLDDISDNSLRKRNDIGTILELSATYGEQEALDELLLQGASLWNIHQTLKRNEEDTTNIAKLQTGSVEISQKIKRILALIIGDENSEITDRFNRTYLMESSGTFSNLIDLSHDLAYVKRLVVKMKESNKLAKMDNSSTSSK